MVRIKEKIGLLIKKALKGAKKSGELNIKEDIPFYLEIPKEEKHGDFTTNVAFDLAKQKEMSPYKVAMTIVKHLRKEPLIKEVKVEGGGFINFFLDEQWLYQILLEIEKEKERFGQLNIGKGKSVLLEFVSANPTGPLHIGHGRAGVVGDVLGNLLKFAGYKVEREYYYNDVGNQMHILGNSVRIRYLQSLGEKITFPENGYWGRYIKDIAQEVVKKYRDKYKLISEEKSINFFTNFAEKEILKRIKKDLQSLGIKYDSWVKETSFHKEGKIKEVINFLKEKRYIYEKEGALWFKSSIFGDDKDRVVIRSNGESTYLAPDIAYHRDKYERGFDWLINLLGPDHHGYVTRLKAAVQALGHEKEKLSIIILQLVTLGKGKEKIPMSTRAGDFVSLEEIINEVGKDVSRFFFLMRGTDSHLDFDLALAKKESLENPVYYIQYAHARICSILKEAKKRKISRTKKVDLTLLKEKEELNLIRKLANFPEEINTAVRILEPQGITRYLHQLSTLFHQYYTKHRVIMQETSLTCARLFLVEAIRTVLSNGLTLLGISAPQKM